MGWVFSEIENLNMVITPYIYVANGKLGLTNEIVEKNVSIFKLMYDEIQSTENELKGFPECREILSSKKLTIIFSLQLQLISLELSKLDIQSQNDNLLVWELVCCIEQCL